MSQDLHNITVTIPLVSCGTVAAGTAFFPVMQVPGTAHGGGMFITRWSFGANTAIAAGSAPIMQLITMNTSSLPLATIGSNGSAALSAGTQVAGTLSTQWVSGTIGYLGVKYGQGAYGAATTVFLEANIQYYFGRGSA